MRKFTLILIISLVAVCFCHTARAQFNFVRSEDIYVDLAWTCNSYVPESYRGKALPTRGSIITVSAVPYFKINGRLANINNLNYKWFLDDEIVGANSPSFSFHATSFYSYTHEVRVIVSVKDESVSSQEWIEIKVYQPEIQVYEYSDTLQVNLTKGISKDLSAYSGRNLSFIAIPYYFNIRNIIEDISYRWQLQGTNITTRLRELPQILDLSIHSNIQNYIERTLSLITTNKLDSLETSIKNIILKINE